ncbi:hypothetical protein ABZP36_020519 [Zizania latifolia]
MAIPSSSSSAPIEPAPPAPAPAAPHPAAEEAAAAAADAAPATGTVASLYVGDLEASVGEEQLMTLFCQVAPVASAHVCRDIAADKSLGYGYVNFISSEDANNAMAILNFTVVNGKPIRIMFSNRDPTLRKSGRANLFVKNLEPNIDNKSLYDMFSSFGTILSCKVATDFSGQSKGYGFVQFECEESASNAIKSLNGMLANGRKIFVGLFMRRQERENIGGPSSFTNVYVKKLPIEFSDDDLRNQFAPFGAITSAVVMRDASGASRCFGFVNFEKPECAAKAVESLHGKSINGMVLYVGRAQRKSERQAELQAKYERRAEKLAVNLYLKNLDDDINDERLRKLFECFGEIGSCKVMLDSHGRSKGSGFVSFTTVEAAYQALTKMNGAMVGKKPLYVAIAQRKEERKAILAAHFAHVRTLTTMAPTIAPSFPPHHFNFGHGAPALIPPQATGFGFQPNFIPAMAPHTPNMMMPYNMQRPLRRGPRHGGITREMYHHPQDSFQPNISLTRLFTMQMFNPTMPSQMQQDVKHVAPMDTFHASPIPSNKLATGLTSADSEQLVTLRLANVFFVQILGNRLFSLVEKLEHDYAGKVTGMILELDKTEVLNLIESPDALRVKVAEAMKVLRMNASSGSGVAADPSAPSSSSA